MPQRPPAAGRRAAALVAAFGIAASTATRSPAQEPSGQDEPGAMQTPLEWEAGPTTGMLGSQAEIDVPEGYVFLRRAGTIELLQQMDNPVSGSEVGMLAARTPDVNWFLVFKFAEIGLVEDHEKDLLDAESLLATIRERNEMANEFRREQGWRTLEIVGWESEPLYDTSTHRLEWALRGSSEGDLVINHAFRLLGRHGVMQASLVCDPGDHARLMPEVRTLLEGLSFTAGNRYGEYRDGDRIAEYGLTALITGEPEAPRAGLLAKLLVPVLIVVAGIALFSRRLRRRHAE